jgi:L-threonine-O-3-phosphate decarboxylase
MTFPIHGSLDFAELARLGLRAEDMLDFSANINPYGPSPRVAEAIAKVPLEQYPDRDCLKLRRALVDFLDIGPECILPGNGAAELIWLAALALIRAGSRVLILGPTFSEYARATSRMGARVSTWQPRVHDGFVIDPSEISRILESQRPDVVFLCNPNNPTGTELPTELIADWARQHPQTRFIVDQAYISFSGSTTNGAAAAENLVMLRSMTKDFGLAGLRLGYAFGSVPVIAAMREAQPPWSVNALAQAAGVAALGDLEHRRDTLQQLARAKEELVAAMIRMGMRPVPSATHFFLVRVGDGAAFRMALLRRGVLVRDCASFGLPAYVRIATRRPEENDRLLAALREVLR